MVIAFLIVQALLFSAHLYTTQFQSTPDLCHHHLALLAAWIASLHFTVQPEWFCKHGDAHKMAILITCLIVCTMCSAQSSMLVVLRKTGASFCSILLNSAVSLLVSVQSQTLWDQGDISSADRLRVVRIGRWLEECW